MHPGSDGPDSVKAHTASGARSREWLGPNRQNVLSTYGRGKDGDMAAIASSRQTRAFPTIRTVAGIGLAFILVVAGLVITGFPSGSAPPTTPSATVSRGAITATVAGIGTVAAAQTLDLAFPSTGTVREV